MPTLADRSAQHGILLQHLGKLDGLQPDTMRRLDLPREYNFDAETPFLEDTWRLYRDLAKLPLERASYGLLSQLVPAAQNTISTLEQFRTFTPQSHGPNARAHRDSLAQSLRDQYDNVFEVVSKAQAYLHSGAANLQSAEVDATRVLARLDALFSDRQRALDEKLDKADETLQSLRRLAAEAGVSQHAIYFRESATEHQKAASKWLVATTVFALLTLGFGFASYFYQVGLSPFPTGWMAAQLTLAKVIIFSTLATAVVWSGRLYRSHRHNYVVNRHRQNALSTFQTFANAADDNDTRSAVLMQATQSIFALQDSGFSSKDVDSAQPSQVLEIFRGTSGGSS